ncbi:MAG: hypothetical protein AAGM84_13205 [Pseudomonadota bacterium]
MRQDPDHNADRRLPRASKAASARSRCAAMVLAVVACAALASGCVARAAVKTAGTVAGTAVKVTGTVVCTAVDLAVRDPRCKE